MARPRTIHDFYGFPDELFAVEYPAPGDPDAGRRGRRGRQADVGRPRRTTAGASTTAPGRCWSTRSRRPTSPSSSCRSTPRSRSTTTSSSARALAPLRDRGVLVVGSGNVVHNLRLIDSRRPRRRLRLGPALRRRRPRASWSTDARRPRRLEDHPTYARRRADARPLPPLPTSPGSAPPRATAPPTLVDGYALGSLSMTAYGLDVPVVSDPRPAGASLPAHQHGAPPLPDAPADDTNI